MLENGWAGEWMDFLKTYFGQPNYKAPYFDSGIDTKISLVSF